MHNNLNDLFSKQQNKKIISYWFNSGQVLQGHFLWGTINKCLHKKSIDKPKFIMGNQQIYWAHLRGGGGGGDRSMGNFKAAVLPSMDDDFL